MTGQSGKPTMNSQEYYNWLAKFKTKKTTDDTFTPPDVYDVVLGYVNDEIIELDGLEVVRPFYPNGDYTDLSQYPENAIVIDNPPFSLSSKIYKFYQDNNIKFFLFAPTLTVFSSMRQTHGLTAIITSCQISYANGAIIPTAFVHNLTPTIRAKTAPNLSQKIDNIQQSNKPSLPKYQYPINVLMVNELQKLAKAGIEFEILTHESCYVSALESQKKAGKSLFGGGLLIGDKKAKALKALKIDKEPIIWKLSDNELKIIDRLSDAK